MHSFVSRGSPSLLSCLVAVLSSRGALATEPDCAVVTRANLVACAEATSPTLAAAQASRRASEGQREAARPFLPENPVVNASLASRTSATTRTLNWSVTLSQEFEIAGQSGLRVETADGELTAQGLQVAVARAEVAEQVWLSYFEVLATKERAALASSLEQASLAVSRTVEGMAAQGLASSIEATVADAAAVRAARARLEAEREVAASEVRLGALLGAPPRVSGPLEPLRWSGESKSARPEVLALEALAQAAARRVELLRRSRAPNPTLSLFAQNDGFDEQVFGVGLGLPIPLPQPVGRTRAGEIAEAVGVQTRLQAELQHLTRTLAAEQSLAQTAWDTSQEARALYSSAVLERARQGLAAIAQQLGAAKLSVREALVSQQALVELLQADVDARHALCAASVRWVRARGGSLEGGAL